MLAYSAIALAAKMFSATPFTKKVYRRLGNKVLSGLRLREGLPQRYIDRLFYFVGTANKYDAVGERSRLLEIGTGWVHWESLCYRLFSDAEVVLFDVVDNRLFQVLKRYSAQLALALEADPRFDTVDRARARRIIEIVQRAGSFEELYRTLSLIYVLEPSGTLQPFSDNSFDLAYSCDVLEHIPRDQISPYLRELYRVLKPGGYSIHQIDIADHLAYFDQGANAKNYLRYTDAAWELLFESDVQYVNRLQRSQWLRLFDEAGFCLVEEAPEFCDLDGVSVAPQYQLFPESDLRCRLIRVVHQKRANSL